MSVKVSGTTITATRGDTVKLLIGLYDHEGNKYIPQEGDSIRFAMKEDYNDPEPIIEKDIPKVFYDELGTGSANDYKAATYWSTYQARTWAQIEGSVYETVYADGTPCPQSITNTLTNVTSSNTNTSVVAGEAYSATLTADTGYTISSVTVMMKRVDVTSTVYNSSTGVVSIAEVNGPIVITATAT